MGWLGYDIDPDDIEFQDNSETATLASLGRLGAIFDVFLFVFSYKQITFTT